MKKLLIATTNPAKFAEIKEFFSDLPIECVGLRDVGIATSVKETGKTFEENAILKANTYHALSGLPTLADDGGLEIDYLGGEPGVHSHRWVNRDRDDTDEELIAHTMQKLDSVPLKERGAALHLVLAFIAAPGDIHTSEASIKGVIAEKPSSYRRQGFPYRSLLYLPEIGKFYNHDAMTKEENDRYNHRIFALTKLKPIIKQHF